MDVYYQTVKPDVNTFWCFTYRYLMNDNTGMDITSIRRARLRHLIDTDYAGSQAAFVERTGINQGELSGLLRKKSFGEKRARSLEVAAGLPSMYLDKPGPDAPTLQHAQQSEKIEPLVGSLTREQQQMLLLIENMDPETRKAWLKISASLAKSSKSVVTESDQSPTANAVDIKEAQPIKSTAPGRKGKKNVKRTPEHLLGESAHDDPMIESDHEEIEKSEEIHKRGKR